MTHATRFTLPRRQRGNTLTGIIIGLVVGLVIAVLVALAITKGSTPFTDKAGKMGKMGEPTEGQASDPNKPLYGNKEAARAANKQITAKPEAAAADPLGQVIAGLELAKDQKAEPKPAAKPEAAPAPAPAAEPKSAQTANVKPEPAAAEDTFVYYLQAGAFREVDDAENTRAKLALLGFEATLSERASDAGVLHRVRLGPFNQVESMNKARARLLDNGIDVAIVRNQK
ncbi:MAG: SPOR domain-containing protein [Pseudomonadota bacterium]